LSIANERTNSGTDQKADEETDECTNTGTDDKEADEGTDKGTDHRGTDEVADKDSHKDAHRRTDEGAHSPLLCDLHRCQQWSERSQQSKEGVVYERQDLPARADDCSSVEVWG
jgi:hypothetical protein